MSSVILVTGASSRFGAAMARALAYCARLVWNILFACAWLGASITYATPGGGHGDISRSYYVPAGGTLL
jgi:NAD(P)-dependent dehydrogenase (short-subunit alcohol dehydrogenase family)